MQLGDQSWREYAAAMLGAKILYIQFSKEKVFSYFFY